MTPASPDRAPQNDPNDHDLVHFLRHHRPPIPPAAPGLESNILAMIAEPSTRLGQSSAPKVRRTRFWLVGPAIAACTIAAFWGYRILIPVNLSEADLATIAALIETPDAADGAEHDLLGLLEL
jgi:hypothetical protein